MKYSLTDEAKSLAESWAGQWTAKKIKGAFRFLAIKGDNAISYMGLEGAPDDIPPDVVALVSELDREGLISSRIDRNDNIDITLFQPLRDAVAQGFEKPPSTPHIVAGPNFQGNVNLSSGAYIASSVYGDVNITSSISLADKIEELMGEDVQTIAGLEEAIHEVRQTTEPKARWQKLAAVSSLISGGISNLSKVEGATKAMVMIAEAIARLASAG